MDLQTPLIFVGLFSIACALLVLIYKFGIKEKSYEEALAEQRHQTHMLLGIKPKPKEKKNKKTSKKSKKDGEVVDEVETVDSHAAEEQKKLHVEFKDVTEEVSVKNIKKQSKKEKVRPILVNKEEDSKVTTAAETAPLNHFVEMHPKDEFELLRSNSRESLSLKESTNNKAATKPKQLKPESEIQKEATKSEEPVAVQKTNSHSTSAAISAGNTGKEKKKKKSEFNTLQQLVGDVNGPNMSLLLNLVRKAELSRSEVQILIDLLLNKQHEAPENLDEWSEGKSDPIQKLKKQLAEKEKLLAEEQQVSSSAQAKLREIRAEFQSEKSQLQQKIRSYEEAFHTKQVENTRVHQQLQQLQAQLKDEMVKNHKLREEQAAIQMQRQQFEIRVAKLQETEVIINQLQGEVQELSSTNNHLRMELARLSEENAMEKERQQGIIIQLNSFQKELEQMSEANRFLEESRIDIEHTLEKSLKQENDFKNEISHLNTAVQQKCEELRRLEHGKKQFHDELQKTKDESSKLINQLRSELQKLQEEKSSLQNSHVNGLTQESKQHEIEILNLQNELSSLKTELAQAEKKYRDELKIATTTVEKLKSELEQERVRLDEQKSKNNELRTKNWKVMEALNAAESRIKSNVNQAKPAQEVQKEFIQRLFPEIKELETLKPEAFASESEKLIRKYVNDLKESPSESDDSEEIKTLKSQLQHYKNVIDNTERMLNKLQKHIEQEEITWRMELAAKTAELEAIKGFNLQEKLAHLENELREEQAEKKRLINELQEVKSRGDVALAQNGLH